MQDNEQVLRRFNAELNFLLVASAQLNNILRSAANDIYNARTDYERTRILYTKFKELNNTISSVLDHLHVVEAFIKHYPELVNNNHANHIIKTVRTTLDLAETFKYNTRRIVAEKATVGETFESLINKLKEELDEATQMMPRLANKINATQKFVTVKLGVIKRHIVNTFAPIFKAIKALKQQGIDITKDEPRVINIIKAHKTNLVKFLGFVDQLSHFLKIPEADIRATVSKYINMLGRDLGLTDNELDFIGQLFAEEIHSK